MTDKDPAENTPHQAGGGAAALTAQAMAKILKDLAGLPTALRTLAEQQAATGQLAREEADAARELQYGQTQVLAALVRQLAAQQPQGMTPQQSRFEARFQALRSTLGGGWRIGTTAVSPVMTPPQVAANGTVTFTGALPQAAASVVVTYRDRNGQLRDKLVNVQDVNNAAFDPQIGGRPIVALELRDHSDRTVQFGLPVFV